MAEAPDDAAPEAAPEDAAPDALAPALADAEPLRSAEAHRGPLGAGRVGEAGISSQYVDKAGSKRGDLAPRPGHEVAPVQARRTTAQYAMNNDTA